MEELNDIRNNPTCWLVEVEKRQLILEAQTFGWYPHFLLHHWPLTSNYFLLPGMCPLALEKESVKQYVYKNPFCAIKESGLPLKGGNHPPVGLFKCMSEGTKSSRSEVRKVKSRQESIKSTSGVALAQGLYIIHTHTHAQNSWIIAVFPSNLPI